MSRQQLWGVVGVIAALHVAAGWGLLQIREVREAVLDSTPLFVHFIAPATPAPKPPAPAPAPPKPVLKTPAPRVIAAPPPPAPAPAPFTAAPLEAAPEPAPAPAPAPVPPEAAPAPAAPPEPPAAPPPPQNIPASSVAYLVTPVLEYPRASERLRESGTVIVRVFIDEAGQPGKSTFIFKSSGFSRLDQAALAAAMRTRFKPPTLNGRPISGYHDMPLVFEQ